MPGTYPFLAYSHKGRDPTTTGSSIAGGTFYNPTAAQFPSSFVGEYFFADFRNGWIKNHDPASNTASGFATGLSRVVDQEVVGKDGELYVLSRGGAGSVDKISYTGN